ncbi:hypothetical protein F4774DRAFT_421788 [Daldinia eschscholtzii]|nr:hypothetical protein F4774DRAFT_421788 [Daldinia eschscholtzii]
MDPASKPGSSGNLPAEEESATDVTARTIKSSGRPNDTLKAVEYDVIDILWCDPKQPEFSQKLIAEKIHAFGDYFVELLQKSKDLKGKLDDAKKNDPAKVDSLKADLDNTYDSIRAGIEAALKFGDAFTISQLSIHLKFLANLAVLLRTLFVAEDYNGRLPKAILKLFSLFVTVDMDILKERLKFDRLRQKMKDNLDEESLDYMDEIFENAKKRSALKTEEAREGAKKASQGSTKKSSSLGTKDPVSAPPRLLPSKSDTLSKKNSADIKRPIDYSSLSSARKVPSTTTKASPSLSTSKRPGDDGVDSRASKKLAVENAAGAPSTTKTSSSGTSAASQSSPANVQSRSRPSGSMLPGRLRLSAKAQPKKPVARQPASSTIGGLLAEINSEEKPKQTKEPERAPETPEETERRLRKEARRKLHVTWKPDDELTEIRFLEHDTAEDKGRDDNMLRDARDNRSEGLALRESIKREKQGVDEEDEETREKAKDITLKNWHEPDPYSPHEKSHISQKRREEMFASRGGMRPVESRQNKVMEDYESRELMSIYTSFTEIPETPRSPTGRVAEVVPQPKIRTLPSEPTRWNEFLPATSTKHAEIQHRWSDQLNYGGETARVNALHRINSLAGSMNPPNAMPTSGGRDASSGRDDAAEVLALLQSDKVKNFVDPDPFDPAHPKTHRRHDYGDPKVQADIDALEDTFAMFISSQPPPNQPPVHQAQPNLQQPAQPQQQLPPEYLEALQKINALSAAQAFQPSVQPAQALVAPSPQINHQSLFAALGQPSAPAAQPTQPASSMQGLQGILDALKTASTPAYSQAHTTPNAGNNAASYNGHQNYWPDWPQNQMQSQTQPQTSQGYAGYGHNNQSFGGQPQHNQGQAAPSQHDSNERGSRRDFRGNREQKSINRSLIGTKACSFWAKGQCAKGSNCTFRHDPNDLQSQNQDSAHGYHP